MCVSLCESVCEPTVVVVVERENVVYATGETKSKSYITACFIYNIVLGCEANDMCVCVCVYE